jgi:hypothetical protein
MSQGSEIDTWQIQCMRRYNNSLTEFVYPEKSDISIYFTDAIVHILKPPKIVRNSIHVFSEDLSPYIPTLR